MKTATPKNTSYAKYAPKRTKMRSPKTKDPLPIKKYLSRGRKHIKPPRRSLQVYRDRHLALTICLPLWPLGLYGLLRFISLSRIPIFLRELTTRLHQQSVKFLKFLRVNFSKGIFQQNYSLSMWCRPRMMPLPIAHPSSIYRRSQRARIRFWESRVAIAGSTPWLPRLSWSVLPSTGGSLRQVLIRLWLNNIQEISSTWLPLNKMTNWGWGRVSSKNQSSELPTTPIMIAPVWVLTEVWSSMRNQSPKIQDS